MAHGERGIALLDGAAGKVNSAGVVVVDAEDRTGDLAAAGADKSGESYDLSGAHRE